jgi:hypothetical protein
MELNEETIKEICSCAHIGKSRRGDIIFCEEKKGKDAPSSIEFFLIQEKEICIATEFYSTGHINYDSCINIEKMKECPYRKMEKSLLIPW